MIEIAVDEKSGVHLVHLRGHLDREGAQMLQKRLGPLLDSGVTKLVLDFKESQGITGAGLKTVWSLLKHMRRVNGKLVLCSLTETVSAIMDVAGFCSLFHIVPDESRAWNEF